jgi:hypothetical protein
MRYPLMVFTFFTTAKPFRGHIGVIQRNALRSWRLLHPDMEIILFGEDEGTAEVVQELGVRHEPHVERNAFGTIRIDSMFARAQAMARHEVLCYLNCDIILMQDFCRAISRVLSAYSEFLAIGRRWDVDIPERIDFSNPEWWRDVRERAVLVNRQQTDWFIDYFVFSRGFFQSKMPPLAVGRAYWDNWTVWQARQTGKPVLDISSVVTAIHQNHDYGHHPLGKQGVYAGEEAQLNLRVAGGPGNLRCIGDATHVMGPRRIKRNTKRHWMKFDRTTASLARFLQFKMWNPTLFFFLGITRPLRTALGLRRDPLRRFREKI